MFMDCTQAQHAIQLDLDGELPWLKKQALRRHVAGCSACGEALRQHRAIRQAMGRLAAIGPGCGSMGHGKRRPLKIWRPLVAAAAAVALCAGIWWALNGLSSQPKEQIARQHSPVHAQPDFPTTADAPPAGQTVEQPVDPRSLVHVEFNSSSDVIAIPKPTRNQNVTILWVYPAVRTAEASPSSQITPASTIEGVNS